MYEDITFFISTLHFCASRKAFKFLLLFLNSDRQCGKSLISLHFIMKMQILKSVNLLKVAEFLAIKQYKMYLKHEWLITNYQNGKALNKFLPLACTWNYLAVERQWLFASLVEVARPLKSIHLIPLYEVEPNLEMTDSFWTSHRFQLLKLAQDWNYLKNIKMLLAL